MDKPMPKVKPRVSSFSDFEVHAIVRALTEWVLVYAHGKKDEVSMAAYDVLNEFSKVEVVPHPQS